MSYRRYASPVTRHPCDGVGRRCIARRIPASSLRGSAMQQDITSNIVGRSSQTVAFFPLAIRWKCFETFIKLHSEFYNLHSFGAFFPLKLHKMACNTKKKKLCYMIITISTIFIKLSNSLSGRSLYIINHPTMIPLKQRKPKRIKLQKKDRKYHSQRCTKKQDNKVSGGG